MSYDCTATTHRWPPVFVDGDACNCGAFYLSQTAEGFRLVLAPAPTRDLVEELVVAFGGLTIEAITGRLEQRLAEVDDEDERDLIDDPDDLAAGTDDEDDEDTEQPSEGEDA